MYIFQKEIKEYLESLMTPLAFYEYDNNQLIPLLVSDGFCRLMDLDRGQAISHLQGSVFEKIHLDDCGKIMAAVMTTTTSILSVHGRPCREEQS